MDGETEERDDRGETQTYRHSGGDSWFDNGGHSAGSGEDDSPSGRHSTGGGYPPPGYSSSGYTPPPQSYPPAYPPAPGYTPPQSYPPAYPPPPGYTPPQSYPPAYPPPPNTPPAYSPPGYTSPAYAPPAYLPPEYPPRRYADQATTDTGSSGPADQRYEDQRHEDRRHEDQRHEDQGYGDQRYRDQAYSDPRYNDQRYGDPGPSTYPGFAAPSWGDAGADQPAAGQMGTSQAGTGQTGTSQTSPGQSGWGQRGLGQPGDARRSDGYPTGGFEPDSYRRSDVYPESFADTFPADFASDPRSDRPFPADLRGDDRFDPFTTTAGGGRHLAPLETGSLRRVEPVREPSRELAPVRTRFRRLDDIEADEETDQRQVRRNMPLWQELPLLLVVAFCLAVLIRTFLLQAFFIPSSSMEETLLVGDRVLVNKIVYDVRDPERGEIVVFRGTDNWAPENPSVSGGGLMGRIGRTMGDLVGLSRPGEKDFIKRVIGVPGDRVSCCDTDGRLYVNGEPLDEPYVKANSPLDAPPDPHVCRSRRFEEVLVPPGQVFVMGDHRIVSQDSRCQGPVPIENIIGRAFVIVWPSDRWGTLSTPDEFATVPGPVAIGPAGVAPSLPGVGAAAVAAPTLLAILISARSVRKRRWGRHTLQT